MLTVAMNDRAAILLGLRDGFGGLEPIDALASGLRKWVERGIGYSGEVVCWNPVPTTANEAPGDIFDLTGWECSHSSFHLEDFVPVDVSHGNGQPIVGVEAQRELLRQGIVLAREIGRLVGALDSPIPVRCIIAANDTNGTFRFHRIRTDESWHNADLDSYGRDHMVVIDFT